MPPVINKTFRSGRCINFPAQSSLPKPSPGGKVAERKRGRMRNAGRKAVGLRNVSDLLCHCEACSASRGNLPAQRFQHASCPISFATNLALPLGELAQRRLRLRGFNYSPIRKNPEVSTSGFLFVTFSAQRNNPFRTARTGITGNHSHPDIRYIPLIDPFAELFCRAVH